MANEGENVDDDLEVVEEIERTPFMPVGSFRMVQMFTGIPSHVKKTDGTDNLPPNGSTLPPRFSDDYFHKMQKVYGEVGETYNVFQYRMIVSAQMGLGPDRVLNSIFYDPDKVKAEERAFKELVNATKAQEREQARNLNNEVRQGRVRDYRNYRNNNYPNPARGAGAGAPPAAPARGRGRGAPAAPPPAAAPTRPRCQGGRGRAGAQGGPQNDGPPNQEDNIEARLRRLADYNMYSRM